MTPHERDLILRVADQIRAADRSAIDPEAERLIRTEIASQPRAAYLLTQRVIVQDLGLRQAQERIAELEGRLRQAGIAPSGTGGGGFLGGQGGPPPAAGPAQQPGAAAPQRSGVGDFLRSAAAAAAGAIGGNLIYDGIRHWAADHGTGHGGDWLGGSGGTTGGFTPTDQEPGRYDQGRNWGDDFAGSAAGASSGGADFGSTEGDDFQVDDTADDLDDQGDDWADDDAGDNGGSSDGAGGDW